MKQIIAIPMENGFYVPILVAIFHIVEIGGEILILKK